MSQLDSVMAASAVWRWPSWMLMAILALALGCLSGPTSDDTITDEAPYTEEELAEIAVLADQIRTHLSNQMPASAAGSVGEPIVFQGDRGNLIPLTEIPEIPPTPMVDQSIFGDVDDLADTLAEKYYSVIRNRYIVALDGGQPQVARTGRDGIVAHHQLTPQHLYDHIFTGFSADLTAGQVTALENNPLVKYVEKDSLKFATSDLTYLKGIDRVDADLSPTADIDDSPTGAGVYAGVAVAIIDSGIDSGHSDLNVVYGRDFVGPGPPGGSVGGDDQNGHGTHVAGIVGALDDGPNNFHDSGFWPTDAPTATDPVVGVAPGVPLVAVRVLDEYGEGTLADILQGMEWITANAATHNIRVANYSVGGTGFFASERDAIISMIGAGVTVVVSAGNSGVDVGDETPPTDCVESPGCYDAPIVVAAMADYDGARGQLSACAVYGDDCNIGDRLCHYCEKTINNCFLDGEIDDETAFYSNYGDQVDLIAPGTCIMSTALKETCLGPCYLAPTQWDANHPNLCIEGGGFNPLVYSVCGEVGGDLCADCLPKTGADMCGYSNMYCTIGDDLACCSGGYSYTMMTGTSMAAPHVAGAAALYIAEYYQNHGIGIHPLPDEVKIALVADADAAPCGPDNGTACGAIFNPPAPPKPAVYAGNTRQSMEPGYSAVPMFVEGNSEGKDYFARTSTLFSSEEAQSLLVGVNNASGLPHGYSSVKVCLNESSDSATLDDYFQATMDVYFPLVTDLIDWTAFGISSDTNDWLYYWWIDANGRISDDVARFGSGTIGVGEWHEIKITIDRRGGVEEAWLTIDLLPPVGPIVLSDVWFPPYTDPTDPMRCLFVYTGVYGNIEQYVYIDTVHLSARPEGVY